VAADDCAFLNIMSNHQSSVVILTSVSLNAIGSKAQAANTQITSPCVDAPSATTSVVPCTLVDICVETRDMSDARIRKNVQNTVILTRQPPDAL